MRSNRRPPHLTLATLAALTLFASACHTRRPAAVGANESRLLVSDGMPLAGSEAADIAVLVNGPDGRPVAGQGVFLATEGSNYSLAAESGTTDAEGMWRTTLTASAPGPIEFTAHASGNGGGVRLGAPATIVFRTLADPARSTLAVAPPSIVANGSDAATLTVEAKDAIGQPIPGLTVTLRVDGAEPTSRLTGSTTAAGRFEGTLRTTVVGQRVVVAEIADHGQIVTTYPPAMVEAVAPVAPRVTGVARYTDVNRSRAVDAGDTLVIAFDRSLALGSPAVSDFALPVGNDTLGQGPTIEAGELPNEVRITLGPGASLAVRGSYRAGDHVPSAPSGIDVSATANPGAIRDAQTLVSAVPSRATDITAGFLGVAWQNAPAGVTALAAARLDRDLLPDLVLGRAGDDQLHLNRGGGDFSGVPQAIVNGATRGVLLADLNFDGLVDVITVEEGGIQFWRNTSTGQLVRGARSGSAQPRGATLADIDRDGNLDLIEAHDAGVTVWISRGHASAGSFTARPALSRSAATVVAAGDVNRDGRVDLIAGGPDGVVLFVASGDVTFLPAQAVLAGACRGLAIADVDRNGSLDIVVGTAAGARVCKNTGRGQFAATQALASGDTTALAMLDVDADGNPDLVLANASGDCTVWINDPATATFVGNFRLPRSGATTALVAADVDLDGAGDLVTAGPNGVFTWFNSTPAPVTQALTFEQVQVGRIEQAVCIALGDLDGDGRLDLVQGNNRNEAQAPSERVQVWLSSGRSFALVQTLDQATGICWGIELMDLDRDGDLDIITTVHSSVNVNQRRLDAWENDGAGRMSHATPRWLDDVPPGLALGLGDFDRDGRADLLLGEANSDGRGQVLFGRTSTPYLRASENAQLHGSSWNVSCFAVGDLNGDGWPDVAFTRFHDTEASRVRVSLNEGTRRDFEDDDIQGSGVVSGWRSVAVGDVDGDGDLDLIQAPAPGGLLFGVWRNDGSARWGSFRGHGVATAGMQVPSASLADLDGDGDMDVVIGGQAPLGLQVWRNDGTGAFALARQLEAVGTGRIAIADIDRDGVLDIAAPQPGHGVRVWFGRR